MIFQLFRKITNIFYHMVRSYLFSYRMQLLIQNIIGIPDYLLTDEFDGGSIPQFNDNGVTGDG